MPVISEHDQYWLWGTRGYSGNVLIQIGGPCFQADHLYAGRAGVATFSSRWGIGDEQNLPIANLPRHRQTVSRRLARLQQLHLASRSMLGAFA